MLSAKRGIDEVVNGCNVDESSVLHRLRNMWQFANLSQWIYLFGRAVGIPDDVDIEEIETQCLQPGSSFLLDIGLAILKPLSPHRGLNADLFDEYARRQFVSHEACWNPFGMDKLPAKFIDFDIFTKIRVLQQMTQWTMIQPERIRERMEEQKEIEQASWRIEPYGWDSEDRTYFVLDDNRIYRLTEDTEPLHTPNPKWKQKRSHRFRTRQNKKLRVSQGVGEEATSKTAATHDVFTQSDDDDGLGGMRWECVAVTLEEVNAFLRTIYRTRDDNEKTLRAQIADYLVPILEKQEEARRRKAQQRERELLNLAKVARAKRSSRIASKLEHKRAEEQARADERRRVEQEISIRKAEQQRLKLEQERDLRLLSRERRLKEREVRRLQYQEDLAKLSENGIDGYGATSKRRSKRRLQAEMENSKHALEDFEADEDDWMFDCVCGVHGHVDDGTHSISCERCNVWQHSKCVNISESEAENPNFHFVCSSCCRRESDAASRPRTMVTIKSGRLAASSAVPSTPSIPKSPARALSDLDVQASCASAGQEPLSSHAAPFHDHNSRHERSDAVEVGKTRPVARDASPKGKDSSDPAATLLCLGPLVHGLHMSREYRGVGAAGQANPVAEVGAPGRLIQAISATPKFSGTVVQANTSHNSVSNTLPPPSRSPTKQSPPTPRHGDRQPNGAVVRNPATVITPSATFSPMTHEQILTPSLEVAEPRRASPDRSDAA